MLKGHLEREVRYGGMTAAFSSGDLLATLRIPLSSFDPASTTVWHRRSDGKWTIYVDRPRPETCSRDFGSALARAIETPICLSWAGAKRQCVSVRACALSWTVELEQTATTRLRNAIGRLGMSGRVSNHHMLLAHPMTVWIIKSSQATIGGNDLGRLVPHPQQIHAGDFWIPPRDLFAFGRAFFETHARRRR
jgi:hypothetical protein